MSAESAGAYHQSHHPSRIPPSTMSLFNVCRGSVGVVRFNTHPDTPESLTNGNGEWCGAACVCVWCGIPITAVVCGVRVVAVEAGVGSNSGWCGKNQLVVVVCM